MRNLTIEAVASDFSLQNQILLFLEKKIVSKIKQSSKAESAKKKSIHLHAFRTKCEKRRKKSHHFLRMIKVSAYENFA